MTEKRAGAGKQAKAKSAGRRILPRLAAPADDLRRAVRDIVPAAFRDGHLQAEKLAQILQAPAEAPAPDRYRFEWAGKQDALRLFAAPPGGTLAPDPRRCRAPDPEKSAGAFASRNVYIEAENLEALKIIARAYAGRVGMIYIDPPYNTGNDFVYNDKFAVGSREYMARAGMLDRRGRASRAARDEVRRLNGHKHSAWLSMMFPRLMAARSLLADDGVIFVSIDDNEAHHLRLVMNEVFGEENFVALLPTVMNLRGNQDQFGFAGAHEYALVFAKDKEGLSLGQFQIDDEGLAEWDRDEDGFYKKGASLKMTGKNAPREKSPSLYFPLYIGKDGGRLVARTRRHSESDVEILPVTDGQEMSWRWGREKFDREPHNVIVERTNGAGHTVYKKQRPDLGDLPSRKPKSLFYRPEYNTGNGTTQLTKLFGERGIYPYPKPLELVKDFVRIGAGRDGLVLDFFSGSATTAHAVMELNAEDGGKRRCVSIQLPEPTPENSPARKAKFRNIADIGRERLIRAGAKIHAQANGNIFAREVDIGFRYFRWSESVFAPWEEIPDENSEEWLRRMRERQTITAGAEPLAILTEWMLENGWPLCCEIEESSVTAGKGRKRQTYRIFRVRDGNREFRFCPDESVCSDLVLALKLGERDILVCRKSALDAHDDNEGANAAMWCDLRDI